MNAGFAREDITPSVGAPMLGWGEAWKRCSTANHDPLYARALWVEHAGQAALVMGFDLCFLGREDADRLKGALGRELGLLPSHILLAASHTHSGPGIGSFGDLWDTPISRDYLRGLDAAVLAAARRARARARPVRLRGGRARSTLPMNRRCRRGGRIALAPNPRGPVLDSLPLALFEDRRGRPVCLLFSISTHPVAMRGTEISADYPGVACARLDARLGATCSLFLQGCTGDSRPRPLGEGRADWNWNSGWADAVTIGETLAREVLAGLKALRPVGRPRVRAALVEMRWPVEPLSRQAYRRLGRQSTYPMYRRWAERQAEMLRRGTQPKAVSVLLQEVRLAERLRLVALEGEPVGAHGRAIERAYRRGVTFPLGYANGEAMYLVTSPMLKQGGYEVESYWEFNVPGPLRPGIERRLARGLNDLAGAG